MKKKTAIRLITEIKANFRYTYKDMSEEEIRIMSERWYDCLKSFPDAHVEAAFKIALCTLSRPPTIADIVGNIQKQVRLNGKSDLELWSELIEAAEILCKQTWSQTRGFCYGYQIRGQEEHDVYDKLSPPIRAYIDFNGFCELSAMSDEERRYERSRFLKAIPEVRDTLQERALIANIANKFKLLRESN